MFSDVAVGADEHEFGFLKVSRALRSCGNEVAMRAVRSSKRSAPRMDSSCVDKSDDRLIRTDIVFIIHSPIVPRKNGILHCDMTRDTIRIAQFSPVAKGGRHMFLDDGLMPRVDEVVH